MSKSFEHDNSSNMWFQNLLAITFPIIKSKPFVNIDSDELSTYARVLQYRVQRDLYKLWTEESPDVPSWEEFIILMRASKELRDKSMSVICRKLETSFFDFDFTRKEIDFFGDDDAANEDILHGALLFSDAEGTFLMGLFLFFAEYAHFNHLRNTVRPGYKWDDYQHDLLLGGELWATALTAFRDAIQRLDFKDTWLEVGFNGL